MMRHNGRQANELRKWTIERGVLDHAEGSALIHAGRTRVLCAASVEDRIPRWMEHNGGGWVTAEYSMLPRSTHTRSARERGPRLGGRTMEIQRLVGRSLRCVTDLSSFGERTVTVDCDVIQADGGTRTASITGAWVALHDAFATLIESGVIAESPLKDIVAAVSVGVVANELILDPDYDEDSAADVDMNVVMTGDGRLVELQATAERIPFSVARMNALVVMAQDALAVVNKLQLDACGIEPYHST